MVSLRVRYLFYRPVNEKIKTWPLCFPDKENPNIEKALFDWPIELQFDVKAKYRLISTKFSGMKFFHPSVRLTNQAKATRVCISSINQSNHSISVVCCFCLFARFHFKDIRKSLYLMILQAEFTLLIPDSSYDDRKTKLMDRPSVHR